jgi:hypothetical protein
MQLVGISRDELETLLLHGTTYLTLIEAQENALDIDHIIPCKVFTPQDPEHCEILWNWRNLRLLPIPINRGRPKDGSDLTFEEILPMINHFGSETIAPFLPHLKDQILGTQSSAEPAPRPSDFRPSSEE